MGWGVMGGLGQALTNIGQQWDESNKIALKDKLEADREAAKDAREEARAKREVKDRRLEQLPDGSGYAWREVNRYGDVIRSTPATPDEVQQVQDAAKSRGLDLRIKAAGATTAEVTANDAPDAVTRTKETHDLQQRAGEQGIDASRATVAQGWRRLAIEQQNANTARYRAEGEVTGAGKGGGGVDVVQDLRRQLGSQLSQMQTQYNLSVNDMNNAIMGTYQEASAESVRKGMKPSEWLNGTSFLDNLDRYLQRRSK